MEILSQILVSILSAGSISIAIIWLGKQYLSNKVKNVIKHEYDIKLATHKDELNSKLQFQLEAYKGELNSNHQIQLEAYKGDLNSKSQLQLEQFKHKLLIENSDHQVMFQELHSKRLKLVEELYRVLVDIERVCRKAHRPHYVERILSEGHESIHNEEQIKFAELFHYNKIYFSESLCEQLNQINLKYGEPLHQYYYKKSTSESESKNKEDIEKLCTSFFSAYAYISEAKLEIEKEFRNMIGVEL